MSSPLIEALTKCRDQFLFYEQQHRAKATDDAAIKANVNRDMAAMCETAISTHGDEIETLRLINLLRSREGDEVSILCDNPDGPPNNAVDCCGGWTDYRGRYFGGDTLLDALKAAAIAYEKAND